MQVEGAEAEAEELQAEYDRLRRENVDLTDRNSLLEKYLQFRVQPPQEGGDWWLDAPTRAFIYRAFEPSKSITFTVCESRPLNLSPTEVRCVGSLA